MITALPLTAQGRATGRTRSTTPELVIAAELGAALVASTSLAELLRILRSRLKWLMPAGHVSINLLEDDGNRYRVITSDASTRSEHAAVFSIEEGLVGWCLQHDVPLDVPDLSDVQRFLPGTGGIARNGAGSLLVRPLKVGGMLLGALCIGSPQPRAYVHLDMGLVALVTLQVAAAVQTVLLIGELDGAEAVVASMARAVEAKDTYTRGHAARVTAYGVTMAEAAGLAASVRETIARAGPLHDVGKIGVPDVVLGKQGPLTETEFAIMRRHAEVGGEICLPLRSMRGATEAIRHHHERWDGRGYPDGLARQAIPLAARVLAIADAFDAMVTDRPYRKGMPVEQAREILAENRGPQWDPALLPIFLDLCVAGRIAPDATAAPR